MKRLTTRILCIYLSVFLVFPTGTWAQHSDESPQQAWDTERLELFSAFQLAGWKLAHFLKNSPVGTQALLLRESHVPMLVGPYEHCPSPQNSPIQSVAELDEKVLIPLQLLLSRFLENHVLEMGQLEWRPNNESFVSAPAIRSDENTAVCIPAFFQDATRATPSVESLIAATESDLALVQQPLFNLLISTVRQGGVVTNLEVRRWIGWLTGLRDVRNLLTRLSPKLGSSLTAATFDERVGRKLSLNYSAAHDNLGSLGALKDDLPKFTRCDAASQLWCLVDPPQSARDRIVEYIVAHATDTPYDHSTGLETLRRYSLMLRAIPERALLDVALGKTDPTLSLPACSATKEYALIRDYHQELISAEKRSRWTDNYGRAVDELASAYSTRRRLPPLPQSAALLDEAGIIALSLFNLYFSTHPQEKQNEVHQALASFSFKHFLHNDRFVDFMSGLLAGKIKLTLGFVENALSQLPLKERQLFLEKRFVDTWLSTLNDLLLSYIFEIASTHELDTHALVTAWQQQFSSQWQAILSESTHQTELSRIARELSAQISEHVTSDANASTTDWAQSRLTAYVENLSTQATRAAEADETYRFMENLIEWKNDARHLIPIPGEWTYYWNRAGIEFSPVKIHPERPFDYLHLKEALRLLAEQHRGALTKKLAKEGFTNELVRAQYNLPTTEILSDQILARFSQLVEGDPNKDDSQRLILRQKALRSLLTWLDSEEARAEFDTHASDLARSLFDNTLSPYLTATTPDQTPAYESTRSQLNWALDRIATNITFVPEPAPDELIRLYASPTRQQRSSLQSLIATIQQSGLFDNFDSWKTLCATTPAQCTGVLESIQKLIEDPRTLKDLYEWRVQSHSSNLLTQFLNYYGSGGSAYQPPPAATQYPEVVRSLKNRMLETWIGFSAPSTAPANLLGSFDTLMETLSSATQNTQVPASKVAFFNRQILLDSQDTLIQLINDSQSFAIWSEQLRTRLAHLNALGADPTDQASWESVRIVAIKELPLLEGASLDWLRSPNETALQRQLTLNFSDFRREVIRRARVVLNNGHDFETELYETELSLGQLRLIEKPSKSSRLRLRLLETQRETLKSQLKAYTELRTMVRQYLGGSPVARDALAMDTQTSHTQMYWQAYFEDQHLKTIAPVLNDLNSLTLVATQPPPSPLSASLFLKQVIAYTNELSKHRDLLHHYFNNTLSAYSRHLPEFVASHMPLNLLGAASFRQELLPVYQALERRPAMVLSHNSFDAFYAAFMAAAGSTNAERLLAVLPSPESVVQSIRSEAESLLADLNSQVLNKEYRAFVHSIYTLLLGPSTGFLPFLSNDSLWVIDLPANDSHFWFHSTADSHPRALYSLFAPLTAGHRQTLTQRTGLPTAGDDYVSYLNHLSLTERARLLTAARNELELAIKGRGIFLYSHHLFKNGDSAPSSAANWKNDLERAIALFDSLATPFAQGLYPDLRAHLAAYLLELVFPLGYSLVDTTLGRNQDADLARDRSRLLAAPAFVQQSFIKDVAALFARENSRPPEEFFAEALKGAQFERLSSEAAIVRFYIDHSLQREPLAAPANPQPQPTNTLPYWVHWDPSQPSNLSQDFLTWFDRLMQDPQVVTYWGQLAGDTSGIWSRHATPLAFSQSQEFKAIVSTLTRLDANQAEAIGTYPALLAQLNWAITRASKYPSQGQRPQPAPPSAAELNFFLSYLVDLMGIDLTRFDSWKTLFDFSQGAPPEHWRLISRSLRDSIVEVQQGGFLGTTLLAPQSVSPHRLFSNHGYIPYPVVDSSERDLFCTDNNFDHWSQQAEKRLNPPYTRWLLFEQELSVSQASRLDNEVRGRDRYGLFHELALLESDEIVGLRDVLEGNPLERSRFKDRWGGWSEKPFGVSDPSSESLRTLRTALAQQGVTATESELLEIHRVREALVDFRRTMNEINIQEGVNWWRESKELFTGDLDIQLNQALQQFAKQMKQEGFTGEISRLPTPHEGTFAERRRQSIAKAIFEAMHMAHQVLYSERSVEDTSKLRHILHAMDTHYTTATKVISVQRALKQVSENLDDTLNKLCSADFSPIHTDSDFETHKESILRAGLPFFDNHLEQVFSQSQWLPPTSQRTHTLLNALATAVSDRDWWAQLTEKVFTGAIVLTVGLLVAGKSSPGIASWMLANAGRRTSALIGATIITTLWMGIEAYGYANDFHFVPAELRNKIRIRDSQFGGHNSFMSAQTAASLFEAIRQNDAAQVSTFRWSFRVLAALAGFQLIRPWLRPALGGSSYLLKAVRRDYQAIANSRLKPATRALSAPKNSEPIAYLDALSKQEAEEKMFQAYLKELGAKPQGNGYFRIDPKAAGRLAEDARRQYRSIAQQLGLDPNDLGPLTGETLRLLFRESLDASRTRLIPRLKDLKYWSARFSNNSMFHQDELLDGLLSVVGTEADITSRYVPLWLRFFGIEYPTPTTLSLTRLQRLNRAQWDIIAYYHPNVRFSMAKLSQAHGQSMQPWEMFVPQSVRPVTQAPKEVSGFIAELKQSAHNVSERFLDRAPYLYDSAESRVRISRQLQREVFDTLVFERAESVLAQEIAPTFAPRLANLQTKYGTSRIRSLCEQFLIDEGLMLPSHTSERLELMTKLVLWDSKYRDLITTTIRSKQPGKGNVSESDIQEALVAIIDPKHPKHAEFNPSRPKGDSWHFAPPDPASTGTAMFDPSEELAKAGQELRMLLSDWGPDLRLLAAVSKADYPAMAQALTARGVVTLRLPGEESAAIDYLDPSYPSPEPAPASPTAAKPLRPEPKFEPIVPIDPAQAARARHELLIKGELPQDLRDLFPRIARDNLFTWVDSKTVMASIPPAIQDTTFRLFLSDVTPEGVQTALGQMLAKGPVTQDTLLAYRLAADSQRTLGLITQATDAGVITSREQALSLYQWCVEQYLGHESLVLGRSMTVFEASPIINLNANMRYSPQQISDAVALAVKQGIDPQLAQQAGQAWTRTTDHGVTTLGDLASALHFPEPYLDSPHLIAGYFQKNVVRHQQAERLLDKLYQTELHESLEEARMALGLPENWTADLLIERARAFRNGILQRQSLSDPFATHHRALSRIDLAEKILTAPPGTYPNRFAYPEVYPEVPRALRLEQPSSEVVDAFDQQIRRMVESLSPTERATFEPTLNQLLSSSLIAERRSFYSDLGGGVFAPGSAEATQRTKLLRLAHSRLLVEHARATGCVTTEAEIHEFLSTLIRGYVDRAHIRFPASVDEAEALIASARHIKVSKLQFAAKPEQLEESWKVLQNEHQLIAHNEGHISKGLLDELVTATEIVKATYYPGARVLDFGLYELEHIALTSHLRVPLEVLLDPAVLSNRRLVYLLIDGPSLKHSVNVQQVGDLIIDLFSSEGGKLISRMSEKAKHNAYYEIFRRLRWNDQLPASASKEQMQRTLERALSYFEPTISHTPGPLLEAPHSIADPVVNTPIAQPQRIVPPDQPPH